MTLLIICLAVLLIIILAFILPVSIDITARFGGRTDVMVRVYYFFRFLGWATGRKTQKGRQAGPGTPEKPGSSIVSRLYRAACVKGVWDRLWLMLGRLFSGIRVRSLESDIRVGLVDDYYTGMLAGVMLPLLIFLNARFSGDLKFQPAFEEEFLFEGYFDGVFQVRPVSVFFPLMAFALSRPGWKAVRIMAGGR